jgi:hypothetical protein
MTSGYESTGCRLCNAVAFVLFREVWQEISVVKVAGHGFRFTDHVLHTPADFS